MAEMHPVDIENYDYTPSEKYMYEAFRDRLDKKYHVFYSVRWFEVEEGKRIDSESDFIVFDPSFGFITIEVKGGKDIIQEGEHWFLIETKDGEESTRELKCSPYEQAEKSMRHFHKYFHEEFHQSFNGAYGFAVAFPWYSSEKIISSSSPRELTIDKSDIESLPKKINEIFHYWKNKRNLSVPFSAEQRKRFISLINKRISLSAAAGALIPIKEKELHKINAVQDSIIDAMYNYREMRFIGGAGTGKTYIGAKKAKLEAARGKKVLFTCCSKGLINYVKNEVLKDVDNVTCLDFDSLMKIILGSDYENIVDNVEGFFDYIETIPNGYKYDCIIVDEAQDYDVDMGLSIRALLNEEYSTFYVFFDENQNVFSKDFEDSFAIDYPPVILRYNIRNTGRIYDNAIQRTGLGKDTVANSLLGVEPEYSYYKNVNQCKKALTNIINKLTQKEFVSPKSIVILGNSDYEDSVISNEEYIGSFRIDKSNNLSIIEEDAIRYFSVTDFKGMEADIIVFINHVKAKELEVKELCEQYVALTRPRYYLYVLNITIQ
jgi:hypothetical protein